MVHRIAVLAALAGCHVLVRTETSRPGATQRTARQDAAIAQPPTLVWTETGMLRFVEPLTCPSDDVVETRPTVEIATRPNYATFTVGVIASAVGGILLANGLFAGSPGTSPLTYAGGAGIAAGLPLAIGPWIGTRVDFTEGAPAIEHRSGPHVACSERALAATDATLVTGALEIHGAVDAGGSFAISPFGWLDAYAPKAGAATAVTATVAGHRVDLVLDPNALAAHAPAFLAHADFDARIQPLERVPGITAGVVRASLVEIAGKPALRIVLPIANAGPGDAWALRGQITANGVPAIDGRMIYVGHVAPKAQVVRELVIPLTAQAAAALGELELSIELRDAHGTAPTTPAVFRGAVLRDVPRP